MLHFRFGGPTAGSSRLLKPAVTVALGMAMAVTASVGCKNQPSGDNKSETAGADGVTGKKVRVTRTSPLMREFLPEDYNRKPALIFYMADTAEPYMQAAVAYEVRALRETCGVKGKDDVNWVVFANSHYLKHKMYLQCVGGKFDIRPMAIAGLDEKIAALTSDDFDPTLKNTADKRTDLFDKSSALKHGPALNKEYKQQPFVHPEVMRTVLGYAMKEIFPAKDYAYYLTVKGHGSSKFVLTGLTAEQLRKKTTQQNATLDHFNLDKIKGIKYGQAGLSVSNDLMKQLAKLQLGQLEPRTQAQQKILQENGPANNNVLNVDIPGLNVDIPGLNADIPGLNADIDGLNADIPGLNADIIGLNADIPGLNADIPGLNADIVGLGADTPGLGAENHFGMTTDVYFSAIAAALKQGDNGGTGADLAFLNIESCESRIRGSVGDTTPLLKLVFRLRPMFKAGYSADGSLWYRSYDWNNIVYEWLGSGKPTARLLQSMLASRAEDIQNFVYE